MSAVPVASVLEVGSAVVVMLATVYGLYRSVRNEARKRADQDRKDRDAYGQARFDAGARSREGEIRDLNNQLSATQTQLTDAKTDAREWRERYMDLRDNR